MSQTWFHKPENALKRANGECKASSNFSVCILNAVCRFVVVVCAHMETLSTPIDGRGIQYDPRSRDQGVRSPRMVLSIAGDKVW